MGTRYRNNTIDQRNDAIARLFYVVASFAIALLASATIIFATPKHALANDGVDATFYLATYHGDTKQLPATLWEMEQHVSSYSPGIRIASAIPARTKSHTFSSTGISLLNMPTEDQVQAVYSYDPSSQYIVWYVVKLENDGWHVDGALIDCEQAIEAPEDPEEPKDPEIPEEPTPGPGNDPEPQPGTDVDQDPTPGDGGAESDPETNTNQENNPGNSDTDPNHGTSTNPKPESNNSIDSEINSGTSSNVKPESKPHQATAIGTGSVSANPSQAMPANPQHPSDLDSNEIVDSIANSIATNSSNATNRSANKPSESKISSSKKTQNSNSNSSKSSKAANNAETLASAGKAPESLYGNAVVKTAHVAGMAGMALALIAGFAFATTSAAAGLRAKSAISNIQNRIR